MSKEKIIGSVGASGNSPSGFGAAKGYQLPKTWQEEFNREFTTLGMGNEICSHQDVDDVKQFITDLRKQDEQQLLLKLSLETRYYGRDVEMKISKIIEEYYAK